MTDIYIDIETAATDQQWAIDDLTESVKPPSNYGEEAQKKWWATKGADKLAEIIPATALDTSLARIICIGYAVEDQSPVTLWGEEPLILTDLCGQLACYRNVRLIGHNIINFDVPTLFHRMIINRVRPHRSVHMKYKPWSDDIFDTMVEWGGKDPVSLDKLCKLLGIEGKGDIDGSMVPQLYADGKIEEIAEYCAADVERVRAIHKRILGYE